MTKGKNKKQALLIPAWDALSGLSWLDRVAYLTHLSLQTPQIDAPVTHLYENGNYIREMRLPKGALLTGRRHILGHEMQLLEGSVIVAAPDGKFGFDAFARMVTHPGFHAVVYCLTDITARIVHPNPDDCREVETLEKRWFSDGSEVTARGAEIHARVLEQMQ